MKLRLRSLGMGMLLCVWGMLAASPARSGTLVIATIDNGHMLRLRSLSGAFEKAHPDIRLRWVILKEHALRQAVNADIEMQGGQFDVLTIGMFETPLWATRGWLRPIRLPPEHDADLMPAVRQALSLRGTLYAAPFYGESSMLIYRKDLMRKAGLTMPDSPTWTEIAAFAARLHDRANGVHGICLRGRAGWGENMALVTTMVNAFGGQWFDMNWQPQLDSPAWRNAVGLYVDLLRKFGPPDAASRSYNENLALFQAGKCALWVDATVAAGFLTAPELSTVADEVGFTAAPSEVTAKGSHWLWAWALAIPRGSDPAREADAQRFIQWATSRAYLELVAAEHGWSAVPTGIRRSTYAYPEFLRAAPWARHELEAILSAAPTDATLPASPYAGIQFVTIPEFRAIGDEVGKLIGEALAGRLTTEEALKRSQHFTQRQMLLRRYP